MVQQSSRLQLNKRITLIPRNLKNVKVVIAGAGSAGFSIFKILSTAGFEEVIVIDSKGASYDERDNKDNNEKVRNVESNKQNNSKYDSRVILNSFKREIALNSDPNKVAGDLGAAIEGSDMFLGTCGDRKSHEFTNGRIRRREIQLFFLTIPHQKFSPI